MGMRAGHPHTGTVFKINSHNLSELDSIVQVSARRSSLFASVGGVIDAAHLNCRARAGESKRDTLYGNRHPRCPATIRRSERGILVRSDWKVRSGARALRGPGQQEVVKAAYTPQPE